MSEWQPIETAPVDQRSVLCVHERSGIMAVSWRRAVGDDVYQRHGDNAGSGWRPTHWMPLPEPPK